MSETASDDRQLTAQGEERRRQLVECAARLFAERGYAETRIKDIVDAAGVAKGLFYWYFENKEALFADVAADIRHKLRAHQGAAIDPDAGPLRQIVQGTEASVLFMAENAAFFSLLEVENGAVTAESRRAGTDQHVSDAARLVVAGQDVGAIVEGDPTMLALGIVGAVAYYSHYHRTGRLSVEIDELAAYVGRSVARTLAADLDALREALTDAPPSIATPR